MRQFSVVVVVVLALCAGGVWAQEQAVKPPTAEQMYQQVSASPEVALNVLFSATDRIQGGRADFLILDRCAQTIQAALNIYRQYVPLESVK